MSSWKVWSCRLFIFNTSVTAVRYCSVYGSSWSVLCRRTATAHQQNISVVGKNSSGQESSLDICRSSCKVERNVDNTMSIVNRHQFSRVVCDPCFTCTTDKGLVAHTHTHIMGLQLLTKMTWEGENCHAVFLRTIEYNNWQGETWFSRGQLLIVLLKVSHGRKRFTDFTNYSTFNHPGRLQSPSIPAPFKKWGRNFTLREREHGGTVSPALRRGNSYVRSRASEGK
jgi:hypothetical protein